MTSAIPHRRSWARRSGAVVVLRGGHEATERELRDFVAEQAADFKVPRKVVFVTEIPKGATGKLQRIGLAASSAPRRGELGGPRRDIDLRFRRQARSAA